MWTQPCFLEYLVDAALVASPDQDVDVLVRSRKPAHPQVDGPAPQEPVLQPRPVQSVGRDFRVYSTIPLS